MHEKEEAMD